jgi:hypothetical protein
MKLSETQKLEIERVLLNIEIVSISMWLNVLYEYMGPLKIWSKALEKLWSDEEYKARDVFGYMKHYIYTDFSDKRLFPNKPLFLTHTFLILSELRLEKLTKYFPVEYHVKCKERTSQLDYKREKYNYKICHGVASQGKDLKDHFYQQYKCIAMKYNWPYIINSDDPEY